MEGRPQAGVLPTSYSQAGLGGEEDCGLEVSILNVANPKQGVNLDLVLDTALGKIKEKVESFARVISVPLASEVSKVAGLTDSASD